MRVAYCTPYGGVHHPEHTRRKQIVQSHCLQHTFVSVEIDLYIVSKARNSIVSSIPPDVDVAWFVDSDILLPPNAGELLEWITKKRVVSGLYFARQPPHLPQAYNRAGPGPANFAFLPVINIPPEPFKCDAVGAGCLLVQASVFRELEEYHQKWVTTVAEWTDRWLESRQFDEETSAVERALKLGMSLGPHFEFLERVGEDFYFCEQLRYFLGMQPLVVPSVECQHVGYQYITRQMFEGAAATGGVQFISGSPGRKESGELG